MNIENAQVQMRKGILEFCILHIISRGEIYASDMLDYKWVESTSGPPRKYYLLTDLGRTSLESLNETWQELAESVTSIIEKVELHKKIANGATPVSLPPTPINPSANA